MLNFLRVSRLLEKLDKACSHSDVSVILTNLAKEYEHETEAFLLTDPDPFDESFRSCHLAVKVAVLCNRVIYEIITEHMKAGVFELNTAACRFLIAIFSSFDRSFITIFSNEDIVLRLFWWAEYAPSPLRACAAGLLAEARHWCVYKFSRYYRIKHINLVPLMIRRLNELNKSSAEHFYYWNKIYNSNGIRNYEQKNTTYKDVSRGRGKSRFNPIFSETKGIAKRCLLKMSQADGGLPKYRSYSKFAEQMIGSYHVFPSTTVSEQIYILRYLTSVGEYEELVGLALNEDALVLILRYIDSRQNQDVRLSFEALKYLASLLLHKEVVLEFLNIGGLEVLLEVHRPSLAADGVSMCLSSLAKHVEVMNKICFELSFIVTNIVSYALWLLECSHKSSRYFATEFLGIGFNFRTILQNFDQQDGLRKVINMMSTLNIFFFTNGRPPRLLYNSTMKCACKCLKRYFDAQLAFLLKEETADAYLRLNFEVLNVEHLTAEAVEHNMDILHNLSLTPLSKWEPANEFINLNGIYVLLELVLWYFKGSTRSRRGRIETVKYALDVLKICALTTSAKLKFCEEISSINNSRITGIRILLQAAEGQLMPVVEIQRSSLFTIINIVYAKTPAIISSSRKFLLSTAMRDKGPEVKDLLHQIWESLRFENGLLVLVKLLSLKNPPTDADSIRGLACKALSGLARSDYVKQILGKLPLITNGQLMDLMKKPVFPDKSLDHAQFCKYGLDLLEKLVGFSFRVHSQSTNIWTQIVPKSNEEEQHSKRKNDYSSQKNFEQIEPFKDHEIGEKSLAAAKSPIVLKPFPSVHNISWKLPRKKFRSMKKSIINYSNAARVTISNYNNSFLSVSRKCVLNENMNLISEVRPSSCGLQNLQVFPSSCDLYSGFRNISQQNAVLPCIGMKSPSASDSIATEYSPMQHSLCKTQLHAYPQFDSFNSCNRPDYYFRRKEAANCLLRMQERETIFQDGFRDAALNIKHIYSRFRVHKLYDLTGNHVYAACACLKDNGGTQPKIVMGTCDGKVKVINIDTNNEVLRKQCHEREISNMESRKSTTLLITSDIGGHSKLLNLTSTDINILHSFDTVSHMEFDKCSLDRIIGTKRNAAVIYDINTYSALQSFAVNDLGNKYEQNRATFDFTDELVLSDGLLYDVRSGKILHRFDKFDASRNGVFHPNGIEIISNSEIWDIRTFKLLRTVAGLNKCKVTFNEPGTVIYAVKETGSINFFYTFDALDYKKIATIDARRPVRGLCCDLNDRYISTIVGSVGQAPWYNRICRLYEVGLTNQIYKEIGVDCDVESEFGFVVTSSEEDEGENEDEGEADDDEFISEEDSDEVVEEDSEDDREEGTGENGGDSEGGSL